MRRRTAAFQAFAGLLVLAVLAACDAGTEPLIPGTATVFQGDQQTATAGTAVTTAPAVLIKDTKGRPLSHATVIFAVTAGGGTATGDTARTGADGIARLGSWTLGVTAGLNTLTASVDGLAQAVTFTATGSAGAPASISVASGDAQSAVVATAVTAAPSVVVKDAHGNVVAGTTVTFAVAAGGGSVTGENTTTDANGVARVGSWTLGTVAGTNTLSASVAGVAAATINATATPAAANTIELSSNVNSGVVGSTVTAPAVTVRDVFHNAIPGVVVTFAVTAGSGSLTGAMQTTNALGTATLGSWTLGTTAGAQSVSASVTGVAPLLIQTNAVAAAPAQLTMTAGNNQSASTSTSVAVPPTVQVRDQWGNAVSSAAVTFTVTAGGGSVNGANASTNASGVASVGAWQLGPTAGTNTLSASVQGVAPVTFNATAVATTTPPPTSSGGYNITVRYIAPPTARQQQAVNNAVARWQQVIRGDLSEVQLNIAAGTCGAGTPAVNEIVDDILIFVDFSNIDGVGSVLGQAGPCLVRLSNYLPVMGTLKLDAADLANMEANGTIDDVVLHEIGHVLGIGSIWDSKGLLANAQTDSVTFKGGLAAAAFMNEGGVTFPGAPVPVENCVGITGCGAGTRDSHWREHVMGRELMTGYIGSSGTNPLSAITVQSLADLGYTVDVSAADSYTVGLSISAGPTTPPVELKEGARPWKIRVIPD